MLSESYKHTEKQKYQINIFDFYTVFVVIRSKSWATQFLLMIVFVVMGLQYPRQIALHWIKRTAYQQ